MKKRALLIVDRGSREPEVRQEMQEICTLAKGKAGYDFADYCFLEVLPPFIDEGIRKCVDAGAEAITVMPYFLYPGMKLKDTVKQSARIGRDMNLNLVITRPLSYHPMMPELVSERLAELKKEKDIRLSDDQCDVLLIGHGSSDRNAHDAFVHTAEAIRPRYRNVHHCFLELDSPNIEEGVMQAVAMQPKVLLMMPYFLHRGAHIKRDVVNDVAAALEKAQFKGAYMARHLGVDDKLVNLVVERAKEVENRQGPDGSFGTAASRSMTERAFDIEKRSFEIIDSEAGPHGYNSMQWPIVRRVIHATADFDFAGSGKMLFHERAIESAFSAIKNRCTIVTDVDMVLAAINKKSLSDLGLKTACYISDKGVAEEAKKLGKTRSEMAMRHAAKEMDGGIVVIGNAPTALLEVISMAKEGVTKPALVVGIPVGFVSAPESKEALARTDDMPFITNVGRKGGSPAASSIINALLLLYQNNDSQRRE
ncbi:precorrin-8X methylmutase [Nitrososphaera viennensis]|uniref:Precorrin-8X methylmutase n=1 Tax=Nitrososphaera viennensis TaxID=1034015 RepID=A0A977IF40_9ARCH|nr:precorrin-8X methylmutase [Nitrososphaera viennensis]UVS69596.1 precorrin-8X methylmutase [Nitrososphaera viennensis]